MVGVVWQINAPQSGMLSVAWLCLLTLLTLFIHFRSKTLFYFRRHLPGIVFTFLMVGLGLLMAIACRPLNRQDYFSRHITPSSMLVLKLRDAPVIKERSVKCLTDVIAAVDGDSFIGTSGKLLLYLEPDSLAQKLTVDDEIIVTARPTDLRGPQNPFEFDYRSYLNNHFIYSQVYAGHSDWSLAERPQHHSFFGAFIAWREALLAKLKSYGVNGQEYAVLAALVLGKTTDIDFELMSSYASAGAIHILAVSGLHVALIYVVLSPLLKRIFPKNKRRLIKTLIPVLLLWLYAGITGFSPSVLRAALMFTCFIIADNYQKENNIYNTMSASALILLWWNPYIILEVGFQLSYLAVLGIVIIQKKMSSLIYVKNRILKWAWELTSVSIAAQLATFALGMFYFHQFPSYFLVSNLFVIPLSTLVLYVALSFFILCWWSPVAQVLADASAWLTWLMNQSMIYMDALPHSIIGGISITVMETFMITVLVVMMGSWFFWKRSRGLIVGLAFVAALCASQVIEKASIVQQHEICLHNISGATCITYTRGETAVVIFNNGLFQDESRVRYHLKSYWDQLGVTNIVPVSLDSLVTFVWKDFSLDYPFMQLGEERFVIIDSTSIRALPTLLSDHYIFERSAKGLFLNDEQLAALAGKSVILSKEVSKKRRSLLLSKLQPGNVSDLSNGAVIIREGHIGRFNEFY